MTDWNGNKDMTVKKRVTKNLVKNWFPDCKGKNIAVMTSDSFTDVREMINQNKIDNRTFICNFDNLSSVKPTNFMKTKEQEFEETWKKTIKEIFSAVSLEIPKYKLLYGNIFVKALSEYLKYKNRFKLLYADSCNTLTNSIVNWINCTSTVETVDDNGVLAFTVTLNHKSDIDTNQTASNLNVNSNLFEFCAGQYDGVENVLHYARKMSIIKELVEKKKNWKVVKMIHYCEQDRQSQMVVVICKKAKKFEKIGKKS